MVCGYAAGHDWPRRGSRVAQVIDIRRSVLRTSESRKSSTAASSAVMELMGMAAAQESLL
jgi:hypothetical protein